jgi:amino-acid N-acetyltransferase
MIDYRLATSNDISEIENVLSRVNLYSNGVSSTIDSCIVAVDNKKIIGTAAIEYCNKYALLKSFAVHPAFQNKGVGEKLFYNILPLCYQHDIETIFLLTLTASEYFKKLNFQSQDRNRVPKDLSKTYEFQTLCPSTASCLSLRLDQVMQYYPKTSLLLKDDIDGVKQWGVSLKNTQFTFFEVEANKEFEMHTHESEQITYVLEGELYFKTEIETICVKAGETIAIPSNLQHGAFTKNMPLKAVDAWSPINNKYK